MPWAEHSQQEWGSDKSRQPRLFALGSCSWCRKRSYFQHSPAGSSQPHCDLGQGEGAGENRLAKIPSKTWGEGTAGSPRLSSSRDTEMSICSPKNG